MNNKQRVSLLNDQLRTTGLGGRTVITYGVQTLKPDDFANIFRLIRTFNEFSADSDAHGDPDFGMVKLNNESYYWKIDYYDKGLKWRSENPTDPDVTTRIMTVMQSCEY